MKYLPHLTATTSAAYDCILDNEVELLNEMCVLLLTRGDGTPFDVASLQEEDLIQLCIDMGQTHPKGLVWFLATELVVLFHSVDEILVAVHGVTQAVALHEESIRLHDSPPSTAHVRLI